MLYDAVNRISFRKPTFLGYIIDDFPWRLQCVFLSITLLMVLCSPGVAITEEKLLDDDVVVDSGVEDTSNPSEPSGEPSGEPSSEPTSEPF